jgi:hypothetical protein
MSLLPGKIGNEWYDVGDGYDGLAIERRHLLWVSLGALTAFTISPWQSASALQTNTASTLPSWDALIARATLLARRLTASASPDEEAYLTELSGLIERGGRPPRPSFDLMEPVATDETLRRFPLLIVQFRLAPGAAIPYHDHRDYIGVLTVTEGSLRIRSFDILGRGPRPPRDSTFRIRETHSAILTAGSRSTVSRTRDNIHDLRAGPEGARLVDFFTMFRPSAHSVYLNVNEEPRDPAKRVFDASWT